MLIVPVSQVEIGFFSYILMGWALLLFGGLCCGKRTEKSSQRMPLWTRLGSSGVLVIGAWLWFAITQGTAADQMALCFAVGMSFSLLGDVLLSGSVPRPRALLEGMVVFGLAHVAYILGIGSSMNAFYPMPVGLLPSHALMLFIFVLLGAVGWFTLVFYKQSYRTAAHYAALPYTLLLCTTAALSLSLALASAVFALVALGALLFLLSDGLLAAALFRWPQRGWLRDGVWVLYGTGQMLIVLGVFGQLVLEIPPN